MGGGGGGPKDRGEGGTIGEGGGSAGGRVSPCMHGLSRAGRAGDACNKIGTYLKALAARDNAIPMCSERGLRGGGCWRGAGLISARR